MATPVSINNATAFCRHVENTLGWTPSDPGAPTYRRYSQEASKVIRKQKENPGLYTWGNLHAAVALLAHLKLTRSPVGVFAYVPRAVELKAEPTSDLEELIHAARSQELAVGDPEGWAVQLARATGPYRQQVYDEWKTARP